MIIKKLKYQILFEKVPVLQYQFWKSTVDTGTKKYGDTFVLGIAYL